MYTQNPGQAGLGPEETFLPLAGQADAGWGLDTVSCVVGSPDSSRNSGAEPQPWGGCGQAVSAPVRRGNRACPTGARQPGSVSSPSLIERRGGPTSLEAE